jgi:major membrane immunogen (membrane-anchored lipoprotein)
MAALMILLLVMLGLSGCSSSISIGSIENSTSKKMSASYFKLSGTKKSPVITVKEGETIDVSADIVTKKGTIDVYIYNDKNKDNYAYEGNDITTSKFTVTLSEPGDYIIKIKARKHKGSYCFTW